MYDLKSEIMRPKDRVLAAINREKLDRVPLNYCGMEEVTERLKKDLNLKDFDELLQYFKVDFRQVRVGFAKRNLEEEAGWEDVFGIVRTKVVTEKSTFWEVETAPLKNITSVKEILDYNWPDPSMLDYSKLSDEFDRYKDYAIISGPWAPLFCLSVDMRGFEQTLIDMMEEPEITKTIVSKATDFYFGVAQRMFDIGKGRIDIFYSGDDFCSQSGLIISLDMFREFFKPAMKKLYGLAKEYGIKVMQHSCGAITKLIPEFIDSGVDILDPIQVRATGMDMKYLKDTFGDKLSFHGAIDQQYLLPFGSEEDVRKGVREAIGILGQGGGYIVCSSHDLMQNIPTGNIVAMYEEAINTKNF